MLSCAYRERSGRIPQTCSMRSGPASIRAPHAAPNFSTLQPSSTRAQDGPRFTRRSKTPSTITRAGSIGSSVRERSPVTAVAVTSGTSSETDHARPVTDIASMESPSNSYHTTTDGRFCRFESWNIQLQFSNSYFSCSHFRQLVTTPSLSSENININRKE